MSNDLMRPMTTQEYDEKFNPGRAKFMKQEYGEIIFNHACLMAAIAPKCCEKCDAKLNVKELEWRFAKNISNFLCYYCIDKLVVAEAELEVMPTGMLMLKEETIKTDA